MKQTKKNQRFSRGFRGWAGGLVLCLAVAPVTPAHALKTPQTGESSGLEELESLLADWPRRLLPEETSPSAAGLEERRVDHLRRTVSDSTEKNNDMGLSVYAALQRRDASLWDVSFEDVYLPERAPEKHLVKGADGRWWLHLHVLDRRKLFSPLTGGVLTILSNGLLFRLVVDDAGRIRGVDSPLAEPYPRDGVNQEYAEFVALEGEPERGIPPLLEKGMLSELKTRAWNRIRTGDAKARLERALQDPAFLKKPAFVLARSATLAQPGLWLMRRRIFLPRQRRYFMHPRGILYQRLDLDSPETDLDRKELANLLGQSAAVETGFAQDIPYPFFRSLVTPPLSFLDPPPVEISARSGDLLQGVIWVGGTPRKGVGIVWRMEHRPLAPASPSHWALSTFLWRNGTAQPVGIVRHAAAFSMESNVRTLIQGIRAYQRAYPKQAPASEEQAEAVLRAFASAGPSAQFRTGLEENTLTAQERKTILTGPLKRQVGETLRLTGEVDLGRLLGREIPEGYHDIFRPLEPSLYLDKDVLIVPGYGNLPFLVRERGARSVLGIDLDPVTVAWQKAKALYGRDYFIAKQLTLFDDDNPVGLERLTGTPPPFDRIREFVRQNADPTDLSLDRIRFAQGNIRWKIPAADEAFDLVIVPYLFGVPHGVDDAEGYRSSLQELLRVTRPDGTLVIFPARVLETGEFASRINEFHEWLDEQTGLFRDPFFRVRYSRLIPLMNLFAFSPVLGYYARIDKLPNQTAAGLEEMKAEVREILGALTGRYAQSIAGAMAAARIKTRLVDPLDKSQAELAEASRPVEPGNIPEQMDQIRNVIRLAEETVQSLKQSLAWARELFTQANERQIKLSGDKGANFVLQSWLRRMPISTQITLFLGQQYVAYKQILETQDETERPTGLDQFLGERDAAIQELVDAAQRFGLGLPALQKEIADTIGLFDQNDLIKKPSSGLEEVQKLSLRYGTGAFLLVGRRWVRLEAHYETTSLAQARGTRPGPVLSMRNRERDVVLIFDELLNQIGARDNSAKELLHFLQERELKLTLPDFPEAKRSRFPIYGDPDKTALLLPIQAVQSLIEVAPSAPLTVDRIREKATVLQITDADDDGVLFTLAPGWETDGQPVRLEVNRRVIQPGDSFLLSNNDHIHLPAAGPSTGFMTGLEEQTAYPLPEEGLGEFEHESYLSRHRFQWQGLKENALPNLIQRATEQAKKTEELRLHTLVLGASTGEELARAFHEIVTWLEEHGHSVATDPEDKTGWQIIVNGIERDEATWAKGQSKLRGESPFFWTTEPDGLSPPSYDYARQVVETLNRYRSIAQENIRLYHRDLRDSSVVRDFADADLVIINHTLYQLIQSREIGSKEDMNQLDQYLDASWPAAWITTNEGSNFLLHQAVHHTFTESIQEPDFLPYAFGRPNATSPERSPVAGLEEMRAEVREVLDALTGRYAQSIAGAMAAARIKTRLVDPLDKSQAELAEASRPVEPGNIPEQMEQIRNVIRLAEEAVQPLKQSLAWARELFTQANERQIKLSSDKGANFVLQSWLRRIPISIQITLFLGQQYVAYKHILETQDEIEHPTGLDQLLEERDAAIQELVDAAQRFGLGLPALQKEIADTIGLFNQNDLIGKPSSGLEEVEAARERVERTIAQLEKQIPLESGINVVVIGESFYTSPTGSYLPALVEQALGPVQNRILFDSGDDVQRLEWLSRFPDRDSLHLMVIGNPEERDSFHRTAEQAQVRNLYAFSEAALGAMREDPRFLLEKLLLGLGLPLARLSFSQREELDRDLALLVEA